jgi:hypothetical protein
MSYSEWLTRRTREAPKYLDTRPRGDASQFTETVKRAATVVRGKGSASDFVGYNAGAAYSEGTAANTKGPQIEIGPVSPPVESYGIVTFPGYQFIKISGLDLPESFTIEWFMRVNTSGEETATGLTVFENGNFPNSFFEVHTYEDEIHIHNGNQDDDPEDIDLPSGYTGTWYHYALSGTADNLSVYFNGTLLCTIDCEFNWTNKIFTTGYSFYNEEDSIGSITNFRITKSALYSGETITIPSLPLSGGNLLLRMNSPSTIGTNSGSDTVNIEVVGVPEWTPGPITSPSQDYGILTGFDLNNRLYYPSFPVTGDFTVELFLKTSDTSNYEAVWRLETGDDDVGMYIDSGELLLRLFPATDPIMIEDIQENTWYHVAVSRQNGTLYTSVNGITIPQSESSINLSEAYLVIGDDNYEGSDPFYSGSISNFRVSNSALYTTTYTIPTAPLSSEGARLLLLATQSNPFGDSAGTNVAVGSCGWQAGPISL